MEVALPIDGATFSETPGGPGARIYQLNYALSRRGGTHETRVGLGLSERGVTGKKEV